MNHTCGCVLCADPYPFDEYRKSEGHAAIRFGAGGNQPFAISLNGVELLRCFEADARAGLAAVWATNDEGRLHVLPCEHPCSTVLSGHVELRRIPGHPRATARGISA